MFRRSLYLALSALLLVACKKGDEIPAFLYVDEAVLVTDPITEYAASQSITHSWVFVNDKSQGVWELPAKVPALDIGQADLKLIAGVRKNGSANEIIQYPFYDTYQIPKTLSAGASLSIEPVFHYFSGVSFWNESFEDPNGIGFLTSNNSDTTFYRDTITWGDTGENYSGLIHVDDDHPFFRAVTDENFEVSSNRPTFLEIDYRSDHRFLVGTFVNAGGTVVQEPYLFVAPSKDEFGNMPWKKIYIDMSPVISSSFFSDKEIFIEVQKLPGQSVGQIWLDNIKLVYYQP